VEEIVSCHDHGSTNARLTGPSKSNDKPSKAMCKKPPGAQEFRVSMY
jgi:hypothetical protein